jgi:hypothetical protein
MLVLLALAAPLAAASWSDLSVEVDGGLGRVLSPESLNTARSLGYGLGLDYGLGRLLGVDVAAGLEGQMADFSNDTGTTQALSAGLDLRFSLPMGPNTNPYLALQGGYCPMSGQGGSNWDGHYQASISLGNQGFFSDNFGLDTAFVYNIYSPQDTPLQDLGVRLGLLWRPQAPITMDATKAPPPEMRKDEDEADEGQEKIAAPADAPAVESKAVPPVDAQSDTDNADVNSNTTHAGSAHP